MPFMQWPAQERQSASSNTPAGATCCVGAATRTAPPQLQAAQQQRHRAVCQQGLQLQLHLRAERARAVLGQRIIRRDRALYAAEGLPERAAVCVGAACRRATRLAPGAHTRVRPGPAEAGPAHRAGCAAFVSQLLGSACCMTLMRRSPPAALQKPFRYAACSALPARRSLLYSRVALSRCCGRPEWVSQGAGCKGCRDCGARRSVPVRRMRDGGGSSALQRLGPPPSARWPAGLLARWRATGAPLRGQRSTASGQPTRRPRPTRPSRRPHTRAEPPAHCAAQ